MNRLSTPHSKPIFPAAPRQLAAIIGMACMVAACGQKVDPFQSCVAQKTAELKLSEQGQKPEGKILDENTLIASAKKACLAAMPNVKEPTITGY